MWDGRTPQVEQHFAAEGRRLGQGSCVDGVGGRMIPAPNDIAWDV